MMMNKRQWCEYHGITDEEVADIEYYLKNGCDHIDKVFNYPISEWRRLNKIENLNKFFRR